jgi:hypothetical protein
LLAFTAKVGPVSATPPGVANYQALQLLGRWMRLKRKTTILWQGSIMKQALIGLALLTSPLALAYTAVETTSLPADGIRTLEIKT